MTCSTIHSFYSCVSTASLSSLPSLTFSESIGSYEAVALARAPGSAATTINLYQRHASSIDHSVSTDSVSTTENTGFPSNPTIPTGLNLTNSVAEKSSVSQHSLEDIALAGMTLSSATTIDLTQLGEDNGKELRSEIKPTEVPVERARPRICIPIARYNDGTKEYRGPDRSPWSPMSGQPDLILDIKHRQRAPWEVYAEVDDLGDLGGSFRGEPENMFFCIPDSRPPIHLTYNPVPRKQPPLLLHRLHNAHPEYLEPRPIVLPLPAPEQTQPSLAKGRWVREFRAQPRTRGWSIDDFTKGGFRDRWYDRKMVVIKKVEDGLDTAGDLWWETVELGYRIGGLFKGSWVTDKAEKLGKAKKGDKVEGKMIRVKGQQRTDGQQQPTELGRDGGIMGKGASSLEPDAQQTDSAQAKTGLGAKEAKGRFRSKLGKAVRRLKGKAT